MQQCINHPFFSLRFFLFFTLAISFSLLLTTNANAMISEGKSGWKYGSATAGIVCGDKLCSEKTQIDQEKPEIQIKKILSPLAQYKKGIPVYDIICNGDLLLVIKSSNGMPACLMSNSVDVLLSRGWASPVMIN